MAPDRCVVFLVVLTFLWTSNCGDAEICVLRETCILPCSFQSGDEVIIHWILVAGDTPVHSYYHNHDQLALQNQRFSGRTSLFKNEIPKGIASLQLTGVEVHDQGRYKCYTSTITGNKESFIDLNVEAPVRKVDIEQVENKITCSSDGIYPEPELTWSTSPPPILNQPDKTKVYKNEQQLYSISSSLIFSHNATNLNYSCTVSAGRNKRTTTVFKPTSISGLDTETTIPCTSTNTSWIGLIWMFNHSQVILNWTRANLSHTASEGWRQQVKAVSDSGDLTLKDVSSNQEGTYTCELSSDEVTYVTNTFMERTGNQGPPVAGIVAGVTVAILVALVLVGLCKYKQSIKTKKGKKDGANASEVKHLSTNKENNSEKHISDEETSHDNMTIHSSGDIKEMQCISEDSDCKT